LRAGRVSGSSSSGRVLFFGRFQPFHYGHLAAIEWLLERYREIVVLVGMADESHTWINPFTAGERLLMIREALRGEGISLERVITATIPTLRVFAGNAGYVLAYVPPVEAVATANRPVRRAFMDAGYATVTPPLIRRNELCGEYIRALMLRDDDRWRMLVPKPVAEIIDMIDGVERVKEVASGYVPSVDLEKAAEACMNAAQQR
jgi:nicotinamide-nucleotide adenylyltransferase